MNYWDQIRNYLQARVSMEGYENWLKGSQFVSLEGDTLYVSVPDRETRAWLETEYVTLVRNGIRELALPVRQVSYESLAVRGVQNQSLAVIENGNEGDAMSSALNPGSLSIRSWWGLATNSLMRPRARWLPIRRAVITRCFCMAAWAWGRRTLCTPLAAN